VNFFISRPIFAAAIALLMILAYFHVFRPKNRERLESRRFIPFEEDDQAGGENDGGK
jgi:cytochrome c oxidase cbb3-type subunit 4